MSQDFETAIRFGATSVRVGSAVFGARGQAFSSSDTPAGVASPEG
jgi:collagenase-like PrtC family protease